MSSISVIDQLDDAIGILLMDPDVPVPHADADISEMIALASELRALPNPEFRTQLKAELMQEGNAAPVPSFPEARIPKPVIDTTSLPTLFAGGLNTTPIPRMRMAISFLMHAAAVALIATSGLWMVQHHAEIKGQVVALMTGTSDYPLPDSTKKIGGGGGGGDHDKLAASKGAVPKLSDKQFTPPAIVVRNEDPKLTIAPTVVVPPEIKLPQLGPLGDPMAKVIGPLSNGTGGGGGIGDGNYGGVGSGYGPGVGPGYGGGIGGGIYRVGAGVSAPRVLFAPDPEFSEEARRAKFQGTVILYAVIGPDGIAHRVQVARSLGMGLDEKAVEAVKQWRFSPATKDGHPVAVEINIEVGFHLF